MALSTAVVFECRVGGSDTNGGGFKTGASGTDWSQQDAAQYSVTDAVTAGTTTITSATANFGTDVVGNLLYIQGGTGSITADWYEITARNSSTSITVDRSTGLTTGTGATLKVGGALGSPSIAAYTFGGWVTFLKYNASPFVISSTSSNTTGGRILTQSAGRLNLIGYDTTRTIANTDANRPTIQVASTGVTNINMAEGDNARDAGMANIIFDGNGKTGIRAAYNFGMYYANAVRRCKAINCTNGAFKSCNTIHCEAVGSTTAAQFDGCEVEYCYSRDSGVAGFSDCSGMFSISKDNASGFNMSVYGGQLMHCVSYSDTGTGFAGNSGYKRNFWYSCIAYGSGSYGFDNVAGDQATLLNCAGGNNTSGNTNGSAFYEAGFVTLTGDPFVDAANGNFALNTTAGAGAACRAAGYPGVFPGGLTTGYGDIGAVQHADPAAGLVGGGAGVGFARNRSIYF